MPTTALNLCLAHAYIRPEIFSRWMERQGGRERVREIQTHTQRITDTEAQTHTHTHTHTSTTLRRSLAVGGGLEVASGFRA
jgi:hypothetical protein